MFEVAPRYIRPRMLRSMPVFLRLLSTLGLLLLFAPAPAAAQAPPPLVRGLTLLLDTARFRLGREMVLLDGERRLWFQFQRPDATAELTVLPVDSRQPPRLLPSPAFQVIDSLAPAADGALRATIRFRDLIQAPFVRLTFVGGAPDSTAGRAGLVQTVSLLPVTRTSFEVRVTDPELFIGEEKVFDVISDNPANLRAGGEWTHGQAIDWLLAREAGGQLRLHVVANMLGVQPLKVRATTERPRLEVATGKLAFQLPLLRREFTVRASRLRFLAADRKLVPLDDATRQRGIELIISDARALELRHTYRLEAQSEPGGALVAEFFPTAYLANNRVLGTLRTYNPHRQSAGYLYLKEGDQARAITNFDVAAAARVTAVSVLHRGNEWSQNLALTPGETVDVRLEGENLRQGRFRFEGDVTVVPADSAIRSEQLLVLRVAVPLTETRRRLGLFDGAVPTGFALTVREAQRPHPLDFVRVEYGPPARPLTAFTGPVLHDRAVRDVVLTFNAAALDGPDAASLYGKQFLTLEVRVLDPKGNLIDQRTEESVVICPTAPSPRAAFYPDKQCHTGPLSLNALLSRKTYELDDWSRLQLTMRHQSGPYAEPGYSQTFDLVLQRRVSFDVDVSFPAGLLTRRQGEAGFGDFSGISLATLAQLRFYKPDRINRLQPYKLGAGFVALNAFNLSQNAQDRDLGLVVIGSISPIGRPDAKLTFPLYLGGGYLLSRGKWFYLLGPGIGVRL